MRFEEIARDMCAMYKVKPAFLGYCGFPYATCCSVNCLPIKDIDILGSLREYSRLELNNSASLNNSFS